MSTTENSVGEQPQQNTAANAPGVMMQGADASTASILMLCLKSVCPEYAQLAEKLLGDLQQNMAARGQGMGGEQMAANDQVTSGLVTAPGRQTDTSRTPT